MIELKDIYCGYHKKTVLSDISVTINDGEITCLLGKNGVGKTTLFKTILSLLPAQQGTILYDGKERKTFKNKDFAKFISYVPQAHNTPFPYKVIDVVLMGQYIHSEGRLGRPTQKNTDMAMWCIKALGIEELTYRTFSKLSGGEKQMVLIARAMSQQPRYIAMDEPTANLDMGNQSHVLKTALMLKDKGFGIIMNTHSPQQVLQYADSVVMLKDGKVRDAGNPINILNSRTISDLYNTSMEIIEAQTANGNKHKVLITN